MKEIHGRTAIITGASRGIGLVVAKSLAREGVNLALAARSVEPLERLAAELRESGVRAIAIPTDVSEEKQLQRLVDTTLKEFGGIDILVNNAGIEAFHAFHQMEPSAIVSTVQVNLVGTLLLTRFVLPHMLAARRGHIVNMSSTSGKYGPPYAATYGATKSAMIAFTQSLRGELYKTGVSASVICPGFVNEGGIYEEIEKRAGRNPPWFLRPTTTTAVANAVIKCIRDDLPEKIVNVPKMRSVFAFNQLFPKLGELMARATLRRYFKRVAAIRD